MIQINFINNLLSYEDEVMIKKKLEIGKKDMKYEKIMEKKLSTPVEVFYLNRYYVKDTPQSFQLF